MTFDHYGNNIESTSVPCGVEHDSYNSAAYMAAAAAAADEKKSSSMSLIGAPLASLTSAMSATLSYLTYTRRWYTALSSVGTAM